MLDRIRQHFRYEKAIKTAQENYTEYAEDKSYVSSVIDENYELLKSAFKGSQDIMFREFCICNRDSTRVLICSINGLTDQKTVSDNIIKALTVDFGKLAANKMVNEELFEFVKDTVLSVYSLEEVSLLSDAVNSILSGNTCLFVEGFATALSLDTAQFKTRPIQEPSTETVIRGPREGFTENLRDNTSLLRRKVKNPNLVFKEMVLGKQTRTAVCVCYIDGIAKQDIIDEVYKRLRSIDTDSILESGYIEQYIEDRPFSVFPTIGNSEKVDNVAAKLLEGRIAVFCDGTPFALVIPRLFIENLQNAEDYYSRIYIGNFLRSLRLLSLYISILVPGIYVALQTFHPEMIPTILLITMAASHEGIPFPAMFEILLLQTIFEILRESGIRLPRAVGEAVSIVGALVVGEAAVRAGIISAPGVIIVAITGITSFIVTPLYEFIFLARYLMIILGGSLGMFGITSGILIICAYTCSVTSFGVPYLSPFAPIIWKDIKDSIIRAPLQANKTRPAALDSPNKRKQGDMGTKNKNSGERNK